MAYQCAWKQNCLLPTSLGLVRGCTVIIIDEILLADEEPCLFSSVPSICLLHSFVCFPLNYHHISLLFPPPSLCSPSRHFIDDSKLPLHPLLYLPVGLILRLPGAPWIKHAALGPGRFFLGTTTCPWTFYPDLPPTEGVLLDKNERPYMQLHRCQLPFSNLFALTAYGLQGQTLLAIILDLARPPRMKLDLRLSP